MGINRSKLVELPNGTFEGQRQVIKVEMPQSVRNSPSKKSISKRPSHPNLLLNIHQKENQIRVLSVYKQFVEQSIAVGQQLQRVLRSLRKNRLLNTDEFSSMKNQNKQTLERQKARYLSLANKEKRMKSRSNLLLLSEVFNEKGGFNQRVQSIHKLAQL